MSKRRISLFLTAMTIGASVLLGACSRGAAGSSGMADDGSLARIKEKGVLVVGSSNDAPFAFIDRATNRFSGIDADIIKEAARRLGIKKVEMKQIPFEKLLVELNNGSIDMVTDGMYVKAERQKITQFTNIWYKEGEAVIIPKDSKITKIGDLRGRAVGAQKGTAFFDLASKWKDSGKVGNVSIYASQSDLMLAVKAGKIAACVTDSMTAGYSISKDHSLSLKILSPYAAEASGDCAAAVRKPDKSLVKAVNEQVDAMKKDGTLLKILEKYGMNADYMVPADEGKIAVE